MAWGLVVPGEHFKQLDLENEIGVWGDMGADLAFALDSVAAIIAVTRDPFLIFSASIFAILGLRPLYFAAAGLLPRLRYLKLSLVFLLGFGVLSLALGFALSLLGAALPALTSWLLPPLMMLLVPLFYGAFYFSACDIFGEWPRP